MLIVDANNVLHAAGDARSGDGVVRLMEAIMRSRYASREVVLVCDGSPGRMTPGAQAVLVRLLAGRPGSRVAYSGPEREADDVIESMIGAAPQVSRVIVVSSDARLGLAAYRAGASSLRAPEFLGHLEKDRVKAAAGEMTPDDALDPGSVLWWMGYFGLDADARSTLRPRVEPRKERRPTSPPPVHARGNAHHSTPAPADDWLSEVRRMWPGATGDQLDQLDMERVLKNHTPSRKKRNRKA